MIGAGTALHRDGLGHGAELRFTRGSCHDAARACRVRISREARCVRSGCGRTPARVRAGAARMGPARRGGPGVGRGGRAGHGGCGSAKPVGRGARACCACAARGTAGQLRLRSIPPRHAFLCVASPPPRVRRRWRGDPPRLPARAGPPPPPPRRWKPARQGRRGRETGEGLSRARAGAWWGGRAVAHGGWRAWGMGQARGHGRRQAGRR